MYGITNFWSKREQAFRHAGLPGYDDAMLKQGANKMAEMAKYELSDEDRVRIENECIYHAPTEGQIEKYQKLRDLEASVKTEFHSLAPPSRERSIALTKLDEAFMMVRAAIARYEVDAHVAEEKWK